VSVVALVNVADASLGNQADHWAQQSQNKGEFGIKSSGEICISSKYFRKGSDYILKCSQDLAVRKAFCV
jgi:hypothetical protein